MGGAIRVAAVLGVLILAVTFTSDSARADEATGGRLPSASAEVPADPASAAAGFLQSFNRWLGGSEEIRTPSDLVSRGVAEDSDYERVPFRLGLAPEEAVLYAEHLGTSVEEALRRNQLEPVVLELQRQAWRTQRSIFSGAWIDHDAGGTVVIAYSDESSSLPISNVQPDVLVPSRLSIIGGPWLT